MTRPLDVLAVIDDLRVAGAQRLIAQEAASLDPARVRLRVLALSRRPGASLAPAIAASGVPVGQLPRRPLRDPRRLVALVRTIRSLGVDLVHTHLSTANLVGVLAARLAGRPAVASVHVVSPDQSRLDLPKRLLQGLLLRWLAARIVVVAESVAETSRRYYHLPREKLVVLPNGIDLDRLKLPLGFDQAAKRRALGTGSDGPLICTVARLDPIKGHRHLLRAAELLAARQPDARYLLVGIGPEEAALRAQAAAAGLAERVVFLGERTDLPEILAACDLFVLPSLSETFSLALREAMAMGLPVVATEVDGAVDVLTPGETGWLAAPGDPAALAAAIGEALERPRQASACAERARRLARERFGMQPHVEALEALYRQVLGQT